VERRRGGRRLAVSEASRPAPQGARPGRSSSCGDWAAAGAARRCHGAAAAVRASPLDGELLARAAPRRARGRPARRPAGGRREPPARRRRGRGRPRSAARSAMVVSVSWPTPETTGSRPARMARRALVVEGMRSSREPPPRTSSTTSAPFTDWARSRARIRVSTAPSPCRSPGEHTGRRRGAPADHGEDVTQRGPAPRCHPPPPAAAGEEAPACGLVEEPLRRECPAALLSTASARAPTRRAQPVRVELVPPWRRRPRCGRGRSRSSRSPAGRGSQHAVIARRRSSARRWRP